jgi:hypothetical protein
MVTLEKIVESLIKQIKPNINDDVIISEEWLIDMINQSRSAMLIKKYVANENFINYYQEIELNVELKQKAEINGVEFEFETEIGVVNIPSLVTRIGNKNIDYFGSMMLNTKMIDYVMFNEFITYDYHRFGGNMPCYTLRSDTIMIRNPKGMKKWLLRALFGSPNDVPGYSYSESMYPIDESDLRQLEIILFQHIAPKLGMPIDMLNNASDETANAPVREQTRQQKEEEE